MKLVITSSSINNKEFAMFKLLFQGFFLLVFFLLQSFVFAQNVVSYNGQLSYAQTDNLEKLISAVQQSDSKLNVSTDLSDFSSKAQQGLDFMSPGATIQNLICTTVSDWSLSLEVELRAYLIDFYKKDIEQLGSDWIDPVLVQWRQEGLRFGLMFWEVAHDGKSKAVTSIAIFDRNGKVLFDTELVNFIVSVTPVENSQPVIQNSKGNEGGLPVNNIDSKTTTPLSWLLEGVLGRHVTLNWSVSGTAEVAPYVTAATNDAVFNFATDQIHCWRSNPTNLPPGGDPMVYFGENGQYANLYSNAIPFKSKIYFNDPIDHFFTGTYKVSGSNGRIWSFSFDFSVSAGPTGIGITPSQNSSDFTLTAPNSSHIKLNNYTYWHIPTNSYRAFFWNGGSLNLSNFNIRTDAGVPEVGKIIMSLPVQVGYTNAGVLYGFETTPPPSSLTFNVEYLRGDAIHQPSYQMSSSNYTIQVGEVDTITVTIFNNSDYVDLDGGSVTLNTGSLGDQLTILSPATLQIETIQENASKNFLFVVQGNTPGVVTPQANISTMGWEAPVPPEVTITDIASIDSNIVVGNPTGIDDNNETNEILDFALYKNYPNPFNPTTTIKYQLPENSLVNLSVYDILGAKVASIINEEKSAGSYEVHFDASELTSGIYFYTMQAGDFMETKKMILMK